LFEVYKEDEEPKADWKGFCMSPVICENKVIVHDNWSSPFCVAIDVATGKEAWRWYPPEGAARGAGAAGTPAIMTFGKDSCAVFGYGHGLCALRVSDGKEVWFFLNQKSGGGSRFPPVQMDGDLILNMGQEDSAHMLEVNRKSAPFQSKELWAKELYKFSSEVSPFIPYEGYLYGFGGGTGVQGVRSMNAVTMDLYCVEPKTGKTVWEKRGFKYGCSLCIADGLMFVRSHDTVTLVEATPKDYKELGKLEGFHKEKDSLNDWVQPVVAGGNLYLKTSWSLFCYKVGDFNPAQQGTSRPGVPTSKPQTD
jgi:outer membrane protein assembly factor BamB